MLCLRVAKEKRTSDPFLVLVMSNEILTLEYHHGVAKSEFFRNFNQDGGNFYDLLYIEGESSYNMKSGCHNETGIDNELIYVGCCKAGTTGCDTGAVILEHSLRLLATGLNGFFRNATFTRIDTSWMHVCNELEYEHIYIGCEPGTDHPGTIFRGRASHGLNLVLGLLLVISVILNVYCLYKSHKKRALRSRRCSRCNPDDDGEERNPGDVEEERIELQNMGNGVAHQAASATTPHRGEPPLTPVPETAVEMSAEEIHKATVDEANMTAVDEDQLLYDERGVNHGNEVRLSL